MWVSERERERERERESNQYRIATHSHISKAAWCVCVCVCMCMCVRVCDCPQSVPQNSPLITHTHTHTHTHTSATKNQVKIWSRRMKISAPLARPLEPFAGPFKRTFSKIHPSLLENILKMSPLNIPNIHTLGVGFWSLLENFLKLMIT